METLSPEEKKLLLEGLALLRLETGRKSHLLGRFGCAEALAKVDALTGKVREAPGEREAKMLPQVEDVIKANAEMAIDQRAAYPSLEAALDSYWENVLDTLFLRGAARDRAFGQYRDAVRATASRLSVSLEGTVFYALEKA